MASGVPPEERSGSDRSTRRRFLRDAGVATIAAAEFTNPAIAAARRRHRGSRQTVAVLGGGVAGLTAAHELVQRGFDVVVYERRALGGRARSIPVPGTGSGGRRPLPGEHGWRSFAGFYHNVFDTMRRIPVVGQGRGVQDSLVDTADPLFARSGGREDLHFLIFGAFDPLTGEAARGEAAAMLETGAKIPPDQIAFFARQLAIFFSSSEERRFGQWEHVSWSEFIRDTRMSPDYRTLFSSLPRQLQALRSDQASARSSCTFLEGLILASAGRGTEGAVDNVLNAPTSEAWIDPWAADMRRRGVRFRLGHAVEALEMRRGRVVSVGVRDPRGRRYAAEADWYVCAMPVQHARRLWTRPILAADPRLEGMRRLETGWMNGIQFYLRREVPVFRGHVFCIDSPWQVSSVSQAQFWAGRDIAHDYGDGEVRESLSALVSDWNEPGIVYGRPARECTPAEIAREVWAQIKAHLEDTGRTYLPDGILHSWFFDPAITFARRAPVHALSNADPLFQNTVGSWDDRPETATAIPNLLLAGDYVRTDIDAAIMEGANESGRAAAGAVVARSGSKAEPVRRYRRYRPPELENAKRVDAERFAQGKPHFLDTPWPGVSLPGV